MKYTLFFYERTLISAKTIVFFQIELDKLLHNQVHYEFGHGFTFFGFAFSNEQRERD